jgi:predicted DNA-binding transcriptional regulator YafY
MKDKKIFRLVAILSKLSSGKKVHTSELARDFNVSQRTIQRDICLLNTTGFPITQLDNGRYSFVEGFSLRQAELSVEEASLLSFLYEISKSLGKNFEDSFKDIQRKVLVPKQESPFYVKIPEGVKLDESLPFVENLKSAVDENRKIDICYLTLEGKEKDFRLDPLKIVFYEGFWYLVARVDTKDWVLKLRLERIKKLELLGETFKPPDSLKTMLDQSVNIWFSEKRDKNVTLKVDRGVAHFFKQKKYFPLQKIKKEQRDGALIIECKTCQYAEVINIVKQWIPYVVIIKPKQLKDKMREIVKKYIVKI